MNENTRRLYNDLVWLWPLWGSPAEYADWCNHVTELIERYARRDVHTLLNMGCGGGKNVFNLKGRFAVTGIDISQPMLDLARKLNPECIFLQGDMRNCSLGQEFDSILVDDAISYMVSQAELRSVFQTAYRHLSVGGVMIVAYDETKETFQQNRTRIFWADASVKPSHIDVVFIENDYDPDPTDDHYEGTMIYLIREHGQLRVETDRHALGLFALDVWRAALRDVGFEVHEETYIENEKEAVTFVCIKP
jgi:SAM-dependent methyltransferase